ncbi:MAG: DUF1501 domain-containing protein [Pseudomonadota bacterium]
MTLTADPDRRFLLKAALGGACSLAAHPLVTPVVFAAAPTDERLAVIVLRGGLDGIAAVQPYGDPMLRSLRPTLALSRDDGLTDLDGFYGLHPGLKSLMPLWKAGELAFSHAVSTPYRDKRSHFDGQDALESGSGSKNGMPTAARDGWLNRTLAHIPGSNSETAMVIGATNMIILSGREPTTTWSPGSRLILGEATADLLKVMYEGDPIFRDALGGAVMLSEEQNAQGRGGGSDRVARYAAQRLTDDSRIVAFSIGGWDTHAGQVHRLDSRLKGLAKTILTMKETLGPVWSKTTVIAITEFGRTARENGNRGTDHGTAGAMMLAGGALNGGRVHGRWPGLSPQDLYENRDLMPTRDLRSYCAWLLHAKFGLEKSALESHVFPGVDMESDPRLLG